MNAGLYSSNFGAQIDESLLYNVVPESPTDPDTRQINTSLPVGATLSNINVSPTGAATCQIPIFTSPGTAGVQPNISLGYSSQSGNGILGYGWNIVGLSAITRSSKTIYNDDVKGGVNLDANNRFSLDGNRLICTSGTYGTASSQYRTEIESFVRVTAYGTAGTGPSYFIVDTKDGGQLEYGNTSDSKVEANGSSTVLMWRLNKAKDSNGNYIEYYYGENNGESYITKIKYTGNSAASITPYNEINFYYETRTDKSKGYVAGTQIQNTLLLRKIQVKSEEQIVREYQFSYSYDFYTHLNEIKEFGKEGDQMNSTIVTYGTSTSQCTSTNSFDNDATNRFYYGDFNGDGKTDFARMEDKESYNNGDKIEFFLNQDGTNFTKIYELDITHCSSCQVDLIERYLQPYFIDFNGDGLEDFLLVKYEYQSGVLYKMDYDVYESTGNSFINVEYNDYYNNYPKLLVGDFNGDARTEIVPVYSNKDIYNYSTIPVDFNGDGKIELLALNSTGSKIYDVEQDEFIYSFTSINNAVKIFPGDFNGDGKTDLLAWWEYGFVWKVFLSTGVSYVEADFDFDPSFWGGPNTEGFYYSVADFNGDGKSDIIGMENVSSTSSQIEIHYSTGTGFIVESNTINYSAYSGNDEEYGIGDFDGDGKQECFFKRSTLDPALIIRFHPDEKKHLVHAVTNGFNQKTSFTYLPLTTGSSFYTGGSVYNEYIVRGFKGPMYCVNSMNIPDGIGGMSTTNYKYENAKIHLWGKGFLGFSKITSSNSSTSLKSINNFGYNPSYFNSYLTSSENRTTSDALISKITNTNAVKVLSGTIFPYVSQTVSLDNLTNTTITSSNTYDNDGNLTDNTTTPGSDVTTVTNNIYNLYGGWGPKNRITRTTVTKTYSGQPAYSRRTDFTYDTYGKLASTISDQDKTNTVTQSFTYTSGSCGRPVSSTISASGIANRTSTITYDSKYRSPEIKTNPLNQTVKYSYDYTLGVVVDETDANGNMTFYQYDEFGRLKTTVLPTGKEITASLSWESGTPTNVRYSSTTSSTGSPTTTVYYDALGRELRSVITGFNGELIYTDKEYYPDGNPKRVSYPYKTPDPIWTTNFYDTYKRIDLVTTPTCSMDYSYSGKTVTVTDCNGHSSTKTIDNAGNLVSATDNGGTITYAYHSSGQPRAVTAADVPTTMTYNEYGLQTSLIEPNAGTTSYTYDALGQLHTQTDARSNQTTINYDVLGRVSSKTTPEGTITYTYDNATKGIGMLSSVSGYSNTVTYTYDDFSRVSTETNIIDGNSYITSYLYDNQKNKISQITYPSGFAVTNEYDTYGYLKKVKRTDNGTKIWECTGVNQYGEVTNASLGNNLAVTRGYDQYGLPTTIQTGSVQDMEFSFNTATGNLNWRKDNLSGRSFTETFTYDNLDRLTNCQIGSTNHGVTYLANGNIDTKNDAGTYHYGTKPHAVERLTNSPIVPDDQVIDYNSFNKITSIRDGDKDLSIWYGVNNERVRSFYQDFYWGDEWERIYVGNYEEYSITGQPIKKIHYISGGDGLAAVYILSNGVGTMYYVSKDYLGNIMLLTRDNGTVAEEYSYDAWGRRRSPTDWTNYNVSAPSILYRGYTGHEHLDEFTLINMNGRVYDPLVGRFLSPDNYVQAPDFTQSYNRYAYCLNNPLKYSDPSGEKFTFWHFVAGSLCGALSWMPIFKHATGQITTGQAIGEYLVNVASFLAGAGISNVQTAFSNTFGFIAGSSIQSFGNGLIGEGESDFVVSFGFGSYNLTNNELNYLFDGDNKWYEDVGYAFGALGNLQDVVTAFSPGDYQYQYEINKSHGKVGHGNVRQVNPDGSTDVKISVANTNSIRVNHGGIRGAIEYAWKSNFKKYSGGPEYWLDVPETGWDRIPLRLNSNIVDWMAKNLDNNMGLWGISRTRFGLNFGCVSYSARALWTAGVPTIPIINYFGPKILWFQLEIRQAGIYASPYLYNGL